MVKPWIKGLRNRNILLCKHVVILLLWELKKIAPFTRNDEILFGSSFS